MEKRVCLRKRDIKFIMFLGEYGIIANENVKMFYDSEYYYKNRLASLAKGEMIERIYGKVVLGRKGKSYLNKRGFYCRNINRDENYKKRVERISDIVCKVTMAGWYFEPSWRCSVNVYTQRGNRFVGVMSREKRYHLEADESFYKRSYIVYFLHKDITPRELKYIDKEIDRNKRKFYGVIIFVEDEKFLKYPKFVDANFSEVHTVLYNQENWNIFKAVLDENYMRNIILNIFGEEYERLNSYIYEIYYVKHDNTYTYVFPMPFADFAKIDGINHMVNSRDCEEIVFKVVCLDNCVEFVRKALDEKVEVMCVGEK